MNSKKGGIYLITCVLMCYNFIFTPDSYSDVSITLEMAKKIYMETCSVCHGEYGDGRTHAANALKPSPRNFKDPRVREKLTEEMMIKTVTDGNPKTAMVSWKYNLTPLEIRAVVKYIRVSFMKTDSYPEEGMLSKPEDMPVQNQSAPSFFISDKLSKEDIEKGKSIYLQNCLPCHGEKGNGEGPRYAFIFPRPRKFTDQYDMKGIDRNRMIRSVTKGREGTQMMGWEGILTPEQINNVVGYIIEKFINRKNNSN